MQRRSRRDILLHRDPGRPQKPVIGGAHRTAEACLEPAHINPDIFFGQHWSAIKRLFSTSLCAAPVRSASIIAKRKKGIWQRGFREHQIRDNADLDRHVDYVPFDPVKHGLAARARDWSRSSFHRYVARGVLLEDWAAGEFETAGRFGEPA